MSNLTLLTFCVVLKLSLSVLADTPSYMEFRIRICKKNNNNKVDVFVLSNKYFSMPIFSSTVLQMESSIVLIKIMYNSMIPCGFYIVSINNLRNLKPS